MSFDGLVVLIGGRNAAARVAALTVDGLAAESVADAAAATALFADRYGAMVVVADLATLDAALLERLQGAGAPPVILLVGPPEQLDGVTLSPNVRAFLDADAPPAALVEAVRAALPPAAVAVGDFSDRDAQRLNSLGQEVERIARALSEIAVAGRDNAAIAVEPSAIRAIIRRRRDRERFFPAELFSDPAWDMLLDLTAARLEARPVSVSSLCIAAAVPTTTALRWIRNLCDLGLFERAVDPDDLRRGLISLSDATAERMLAYLAGRGAVV